MWNADHHINNTLARRVTNRLSARAWQPTRLRFRPSFSAGNVPPTYEPPTHKLRVTMGDSSNANSLCGSNQANLALAKTPDSKGVTWMLIER